MNNKVIFDLLKYGVSEGFAKLIPFILSIILALMLSAENYGKLGLLFVLNEIALILISNNIQASLRINYFKIDNKKLSQYYFNHLLNSSLACILLMLALVVLNVELLIVLSVGFSALIRTCSLFCLSIFQCNKNSTDYTIANLSYILTLPITTLILVCSGYSYKSWLAGIVVAAILQLAVIHVLIHKRFGRISIINKFSPELALSAFVFGVMFMPQAIGWWLKTAGDRYAIASILGERPLGEYTLSFQLANAHVIFVSIVNLVGVPVLNENLRDGEYIYIKSILNKMMILVFIGWAFISILMCLVLKIFFMSEYPNALCYFVIFSASLLPQCAMMIYVNLEYYFGGVSFVAKIILFASIVQFFLSYFIIAETIGVLGVIALSGFINLVCFVLVFCRANKSVNSRLDENKCGDQL